MNTLLTETDEKLALDLIEFERRIAAREREEMIKSLVRDFENYGTKQTQSDAEQLAKVYEHYYSYIEIQPDEDDEWYFESDD